MAGTRRIGQFLTAAVVGVRDSQKTGYGQQGVQGSYNQPTTMTVAEQMRAESARWVRSMVQELRYKESEMARWRQFAQRAH